MARISLIGIGRWGTNILNTLESIPGVEVFKCEADDVEAVIIATPGSTHAKVAMPFVKKGLPVFIEKPMTTSMKDAEKLMVAAKKFGSKIFVGHIHLYNPAFLKAKEMVKSIGKIQLITYEGMAPGPVRDDMSVLWDWGPHGLSMAMDLLGKKPQEVQAWGKKLKKQNKLDDVVQARYKFPNDVDFLMTNSWVSPEKKMKLTIIGSKGSIVFNDRADKKVVLHKDGEEKAQKHRSISPLENELREFLKVVKNKSNGGKVLDNGTDVIQALEATDKSISLDGRKVEC